MYTQYESRVREIIFMMKVWARFSGMLHTDSPHPAHYCGRASTLSPKKKNNNNKEDTERAGYSQFIQGFFSLHIFLYTFKAGNVV